MVERMRVLCDACNRAPAKSVSDALCVTVSHVHCCRPITPPCTQTPHQCDRNWLYGNWTYFLLCPQVLPLNIGGHVFLSSVSLRGLSSYSLIHTSSHWIVQAITIRYTMISFNNLCRPFRFYVRRCHCLFAASLTRLFPSDIVWQSTSSHKVTVLCDWWCLLRYWLTSKLAVMIKLLYWSKGNRRVG